jgi:hypothetical protein
MRRFLLHVLPIGFHRIRHHGLLAKAHRRDDTAAIAAARRLLNVPAPAPTNEAESTMTPLEANLGSFATAAAAPCSCWIASPEHHPFAHCRGLEAFHDLHTDAERAQRQRRRRRAAEGQRWIRSTLSQLTPTQTGERLGSAQAHRPMRRRTQFRLADARGPIQIAIVA